MQELQDRVQGAQWFTKMDLKNGFHLIRIREGDEWKTAFRTRYGLYKFQVIPIGLTNAPSTFQDMMNHVFSVMLDTGLLAYMDNILVYSKTRDEHDEKVKKVLERLMENGLAVSADKCVWRVQEVEFLGYVIGQEGIKMSQENVKAILSWRMPESLADTQSFLGFANFYRRFIHDYSRIARPLTELTKGEGKNWAWNKEAEAAFREVKRRFTTVPVLAHFNGEKPVIIETDTSDFAIGAVLSQRDPEGRLHPVAFHSRKFQPAEINYEIHDKELLAIVDVFKHWCRYCEGATHQVQVYSDHQNLDYFMTTKVLNHQQARWAQELPGIDFRIYYQPGSRNGKLDALSRRSEYRPERGGSENQLITMVLKKEHFAKQQALDERKGKTFICSSVRLASIPPRKWSQGFTAEVKEKGKMDKEYQQAWGLIKKEVMQERPVSDSRQAREETGDPREVSQRGRKEKKLGETLEIKNGLLYRKGMLWIPEDGKLIGTILESEHDSKIAGRMGQDKTIELIRRNFWWPGMDKRIIDYVRSCPERQKNKATRHHPYRLSSPLEHPFAPWQSIAMDFITELPKPEGCDQLWVVIDQYIKMAHFLPLPKEGKTAADLEVIFAREIGKHHGLPTDIVSDRDSRFTSETW